MTSPVIGFNKSFQIDVRRVVERLKKGRVGKHIEDVMHTDEVQQYFAQILVIWAIQRAEKLSGNAKKEFREMTKPEFLWKNLSVNLSLNIFNSALEGWLSENDKDFDDVIIDFVTADMVKMVIDTLREKFESIANQMQGRVIPFQSPYGGSPYLN